MSARSGIHAGGNWIVDKLKLIDVYPQQDALANIISESTGNGGSPFNILVDFAQLGASFPTTAVGLIGNDANGEWIRGECRAHKIDMAQLRTHPEAPTSFTDVMTVKSTGRRTFFHQRGANAFLDDGHFDFTSSSAKIFHLGYLLLLDRLDAADAEYGTVASRVLHRARQAGCKTSIDVVSEDSQRFAQIVLPALRYVDYCIINEFELERTTGLKVRLEKGIDFRALRAGAEKLLTAGVSDWVVIHFPEGGAAVGRDQKLHVQGSLLLPQSEIVSAVGAGDAFAAGILFALHEELPIETALKYGVCCAASCLGGTGTSNGIKPLKDVLALEQRFGTRTLTVE